MESMEDFEKMLEASFTPVHNGDILDGIILDIREDSLVMDIHSYMDGVLPVSELLYEDESLSDFHVGDTMKVMVSRVDGRESTIWLSRKQADEVVIWDELKSLMQEKTPITVQVKEAVKGGLRARYKGITCFIPRYQIAEEEVEHPEVYVGDNLKVMIRSVEPERGNVVVSARDYIRNRMTAARDAFIRGVSEGDVYAGRVVRIEEYGAFVEIEPGVTGLIYKSELTWSRSRHPSDVVSVGDHVKVTVLGTDPEKGRISLRLKDLNEDPWLRMSYIQDQKIDGVIVTKIIAGGCFVQIEDGLEGFLPISQISEKRIRSVSELLHEGDEISVRVLKVDLQAKRLTVSMRDMEPEEDTSLYQNDEGGYSISDAFQGISL